MSARTSAGVPASSPFWIICALVAALEHLAGNATLRSFISRNARCFWTRHFGHVDDIMRRFVCGLSARQRKSNY